MKDEFTTKLENYIEELKDNGGGTATQAILKAFLTFYESESVPISEYTSELIGKHLTQSSGTAGTSRMRRSTLKSAFNELGYPQVAAEVQKTGFAFAREYFKSFKELDDLIEKARRKEMGKVDEKYKVYKCDGFTQSQVIVYMMWIGVPRDEILELSLSDIDMDKKCVVSNGREYSFADNPKIEQVFKDFMEADSYVTTNRARHAKRMYYRVMPYNSDRLFRNSNDAKKSTAMALFSIKRKLEGNKRIEYLTIARSGQFKRGYMKLTKGKLPNFSDYESLWKYFGAIVDNGSAAQMLRKEWEMYLDMISPEFDS